ncbi:N-acetyltransferase [Halorussus rarus]|uniref:GNAT family N-acetyltransferase n=1 Tax=Halorussus TaxID=1070314 RepID=UPI000E218012|nr:GNAT family N-acetyltransferase [Halorussus rarus]NHN59659.1 GNAT family N-acetyltransferase [Halorussus sp. JP-T4]
MIRPARSADRERLREVQTSLREPNPALLTYALDGPPVALVSTTPGDRPVGYLVAFHDEVVGYVAEIAVEPTHRREGRARCLLAGAFERLRDAGCSRVRLTVHPANGAARSLYESVDFEEIGRETDYYADGSPGITMERPL